MKPRSWQQDKHFLAMLNIVYDEWGVGCIVGLKTIQLLYLGSKWSVRGLAYVLFVLTACVYVCESESETERFTTPNEVFTNVCLTRADADCIPVNHHGRQKIIQNQRKDWPYHVQLSCMFQSKRCKWENLLQIV